MLRVALLLVVVLVAGLSQTPAPAQAPAPQSGYTLVGSFPHDSEAFTQGLEFKGTRFFETTGLEGRSSLRRVDLETGTVQQMVELGDEHFGEGMTIFDGRLFWITWQSETAFVYDPVTFERLRRYTYAGEGWGLTHNRRNLVMSNGSDKLVFRNPTTFKIRRRVNVHDNGEPVDNLNELEWVNGEVLANVWRTARIARIDPTDGRIVGWIDLDALRDAENAESPEADVLNGIAYMKKQDRLFVTGKFWRHVYEIELTD